MVEEHTFGDGRWGCDCTRPEDRSGPPADPRKAGEESYLSAQDRTQEPLARKAQGQPDEAQDPDWRPDHQRLPGPQDRSAGRGRACPERSLIEERCRKWRPRTACR
jgi:hypothetical protein